MSEGDLISIAAVNVYQRIGVLESGEAFPLIDFLDGDGDKTDDADASVIIFGRLSNDMWVAIDRREFVDAPLH